MGEYDDYIQYFILIKQIKVCIVLFIFSDIFCLFIKYTNVLFIGLVGNLYYLFIFTG